MIESPSLTDPSRRKTRANWSPETEANVFVACRRRCAFCCGFNGDASLKEQTELNVWFTEQYDVVRARFAPFLALANFSTSGTGTTEIETALKPNSPVGTE
jgi:hypothetical protein